MRVSIAGVGAVSALGFGASALQRGLSAGVSGVAFAERFAEPSFPVAAVDLDTADREDRARVLAEFAAREAIDEAGWSPDALASGRTMLVVASTKAGLNVAERIMEGRVDAEHGQQAFLFALAPRLAETLGLRGPVCTVSLACASGLVAVGQARLSLARGEVDRALVVGTDALCNFIYRGFASLQALDPKGARPFDQTRSGLSVGEGSAAVALEQGSGPLTVAGYGASNDANHITGPSRDGRGLVRALEDGLADAKAGAGDVGFAVLHGTATKYNDAMEGVAYSRVFGARSLPVLSVKGAVGHTMGAAGLINLVTTVNALRAGEVPPSVGVSVVDPEIPLDVVDAPRAVETQWAVTSASGFAGVNAAVVLHAAARSGGAAHYVPVRDARRDDADSANDGASPQTSMVDGPPAASDGASTGDDSPAVHPASDGSPTDRSAPEVQSGPVLTAFARLAPERAEAVQLIGARAARRLDDLCLFGVAVGQAVLTQSGLTAEAFAAGKHGLVLGTALGCLESDYGFYARELAPDEFDPSPRLFAYTLPNIVLGETAIRHGLQGENLVLSAGRASGLTALVEASERIRSGAWDRALVVVADAVGPAADRLTPDGTTGVAMGWLLEHPQAAEARGATILGRLSGRRWSVSTGDLGSPARVAPAETRVEPLGAAGLVALATSVTSQTSGRVEVECPSGYAASITFSAPT